MLRNILSVVILLFSSCFMTVHAASITEKIEEKLEATGYLLSEAKFMLSAVDYMQAEFEVLVRQKTLLEAEERKACSEKILAAEGIPINPSLPTIRTKKEIKTCSNFKKQ